MGRKPKTKSHKIKALSEYLEDTSHSEFAKSVQISQSHLSLILTGIKKASLPLCNRIIQATRLEVKFKDLRPDLYEDILQIGRSIKEDCMDKIGCLFENGPIEIEKVAQYYDDAHCFACPNHDTCKILTEGAAQKPVEEADFRHHEKLDNEGPDAS